LFVYLFWKIGGFCVLNNLAVAAKGLLGSFSDEIDKILIIDWDVHHGNGTQSIFYDSNQVMMISIHRYDIFPNGCGCNSSSSSSNDGNGGVDCIGNGDGEGYNVNIPLIGSEYTNDDFKHIFNILVIPLALQFNPDFVLVSAGFDGLKGDVGGFSLTPPIFGWMTSQIRNLGKRMALVLEGGYKIQSLPKCVKWCLRGLVEEVGDEVLEIGYERDESEEEEEENKFEKNENSLFEDGFNFEQEPSSSDDNNGNSPPPIPLPPSTSLEEEKDTCFVLEGTIQSIIQVLEKMDSFWPGLSPFGNHSK